MANCLDCGGTECFCLMELKIKKLTEACQLFTQGLGGPEGYYGHLGAIKTKEALNLMEQANVKPIFYWDAPERSR